MTQNEENTRYLLTVSNTGVPFPDDILLDNPNTLGLQLISTLVDQIGGTVELRKKPNTIFTVKFPVEPE